MASKFIVIAFAFGVILLVIAFAFPSLLAAPTTPSDQTLRLSTSSAVSAGGVLEVEASEMDGANDTATILVRDTTDFAQTQTTLSASQTDTVTLNGQDIDVTLESFTGPSEAFVTLSYAPTFGWDGPAQALSENIHILIVLLGFVLISALLWAVMAQ